MLTRLGGTLRKRQTPFHSDLGGLRLDLHALLKLPCELPRSLLAADGTSLRLCKLARPLSFAGLACYLYFVFIRLMLSAGSAAIHAPVTSTRHSCNAREITGGVHASSVAIIGWQANPRQAGSSHTFVQMQHCLFVHVFSSAALEHICTHVFRAWTRATMLQKRGCLEVTAVGTD